MSDIGIGLMVLGVAFAIVSFGNAWDRWRDARKARRERELVERIIGRKLEDWDR